MKDTHDIYTRFKKEFPEVHAKHEALGKEVHEGVGPLEEKSRWLIKIPTAGFPAFMKAYAVLESV